MKYFKNTEMAKLYGVSEKSVRNWIQAAQEGKLDLQLFENDGKFWIANTSKNAVTLERQAEKGKKFKNLKSFKTVSPSELFYKVYEDRQILDIISHLTIHHESPLQYTYVDGGAKDWDRYATRLFEEESPNILNNTLDMLEATRSSIDQLLEGYEKVNVVDLGSGNGLPIRSTLAYFLKDGRLNSYIPIDISKDMLNILENNITAWYGDNVRIDANLRDMSYERFNDLLARNTDTGVKTANLVFLLGGTLSNFRTPTQILQSISNSMELGDILLYSCYLDTPSTRRYFDFYATPERKVPILDGMILEFLNIDQSMFEVEQKFDEEKRARTICIKPLVDISIRFDLKSGPRTVEMLKGDPYLIWRHRHKDPIETISMFKENSFDIMQATKSKNQEFLLLSAKIHEGSEG